LLSSNDGSSKIGSEVPLIEFVVKVGLIVPENEANPVFDDASEVTAPRKVDDQPILTVSALAVLAVPASPVAAARTSPNLYRFFTGIPPR
jgi:hypothetical protein